MADMFPDHNIDDYIYPDLQLPRPGHISSDLHLYVLVGEAVYSRGIDGRGIDGEGNDDREKDVVPPKSFHITRKITKTTWTL